MNQDLQLDQSIIKSSNQHSQEIKLKNNLKQTRMNNSNQMRQYYQNYIIIITYFQSTTYEFSLDTLQYSFKLVFFNKQQWLDF